MNIWPGQLLKLTNDSVSNIKKPGAQYKMIRKD